MADLRSITENLEVKKDGLAQLQDGSWVLKLKVHPNDMAVSLMQAPMGTRYVAALVEIDETEQPVERKDGQQKAPREFRSLPRSQQAALAGDREAFWRFLSENLERPVTNADEAKIAVRRICGVTSRSELESNSVAADRWDELYSQFEAWLNDPVLA